MLIHETGAEATTEVVTGFLTDATGAEATMEVVTGLLTDVEATMELVTVLIDTTVATAAEIQATAQGEIIAEKMDPLASLVTAPGSTTLRPLYR